MKIILYVTTEMMPFFYVTMRFMMLMLTVILPLVFSFFWIFTVMEYSSDESMFMMLRSFHLVKILEYSDFGKSFTESVISTFFLIQMMENYAMFSFFEMYWEGYSSWTSAYILEYFSLEM